MGNCHGPSVVRELVDPSKEACDRLTKILKDIEQVLPGVQLVTLLSPKGTLLAHSNMRDTPYSDYESILSIASLQTAAERFGDTVGLFGAGAIHVQGEATAFCLYSSSNVLLCFYVDAPSSTPFNHRAIDRHVAPHMKEISDLVAESLISDD